MPFRKPTSDKIVGYLPVNVPCNPCAGASPVDTKCEQVRVYYPFTVLRDGLVTGPTQEEIDAGYILFADGSWGPETGAGIRDSFARSMAVSAALTESSDFSAASSGAISQSTLISTADSKAASAGAAAGGAGLDSVARSGVASVASLEASDISSASSSNLSQSLLISSADSKADSAAGNSTDSAARSMATSVATQEASDASASLSRDVSQSTLISTADSKAGSAAAGATDSIARSGVASAALTESSDNSSSLSRNVSQSTLISVADSKGVSAAGNSTDSIARSGVVSAALADSTSASSASSRDVSQSTLISTADSKATSGGTDSTARSMATSAASTDSVSSSSGSSRDVSQSILISSAQSTASAGAPDSVARSGVVSVASLEASDFSSAASSNLSQSSLISTADSKAVSAASVGGGGTGANPTASVGLSPVNGVATTFMRSDAAPALSVAIVPTWTGIHTFTPQIVITGGAKFSGNGTITGASGAVTITASGTNQNVVLTASGTGVVSSSPLQFGVASATAATGTLRIYGDTDATTYVVARRASASNSGAAYLFSKARGSIASPTAPFLDDRLGVFGAGGQTGSVWNDTAGVLFFLASEAWGATANGTKLVVSLTPNTTTTRADKFTFAGDGRLYFQDTAGGWITGGANTLVPYLNTNVDFGVGTTTPNYTTFGRAITIEATTSSALELSSTRADADAVVIGSLSGNYRTNSSSHQRFAEIQIKSDGATANQRGGAFVFFTKADAVTTFTEKARLSSAGNWLVGTTTETGLSGGIGCGQNLNVAGVSGLGISSSSTTQLNLAIGTTAISSLRIGHGAAPTTPVNGDMWTTTAGLYVRISGATVGPLGTAGTGTVNSGTAAYIAYYASTGTAVSASSAITIGAADITLTPIGTGKVNFSVTSGYLSINSSGTSPAFLNFNVSGSDKGVIGAAGTTNGLTAGSVAGDIVIRNSATTSILFTTDGGVSAAVKIVSSTGQLSVLKTIASTSTTTGALIVAGGVGIAGALNVGGQTSVTSPSDNNRGQLILASSNNNNAGLSFMTAGTSAMRNWQIQTNYAAAGDLCFYISTSNGASNPTTLVAEMTAAGLSVTGQIFGLGSSGNGSFGATTGLSLYNTNATAYNTSEIRVYDSGNYLTAGLSFRNGVHGASGTSDIFFHTRLSGTISQPVSISSSGLTANRFAVGGAVNLSYGIYNLFSASGDQSAGIVNSPTFTAIANGSTFYGALLSGVYAKGAYTGLLGYNAYITTPNVSGAGTFGTFAQLRIDAALAASSSYGIWQTGTDANVFGGSISCGALAVTGGITATGNITAYYSDDRLKTRLGNITNALDRVCTLTGFFYEANATAQALGYKAVREVGLSAQDVEAVLPEVVRPAPIDAKYLTLDYARVVPLLVEAIKELNVRFESYKRTHP